MAFHGRQKSKWYLSFQQLIAASAPLMFCSARSLALSAASMSVRVMSCRATSFQLNTGALCHHLATYVCWSVRVEPVALPRALTSLNSVAHCALSSAGGGAERNCEELWMRNGRTSPAHGVGSSSGAPVGPRSGCQCPGAELGTHADGPNRPSPSRASSIAAAAACPIATPCFLNEPLSTEPSEAVYADDSELSNPARPGKGTRSGAVATSSESTSYAAVATAASTDALAPVRRSSRYGRCCFGPIALTASYTAPCTMPMLIENAGGAPPSGPGSAPRVVVATWFQ